MLISNTVSRFSTHNTDANNKSEIAGLNITIHDKEVNIMETRIYLVRTLTSKENELQ